MDPSVTYAALGKKVESVYPLSAYIAQQGEDKTRNWLR
jgi:hypothetical protein